MAQLFELTVGNLTDIARRAIWDIGVERAETAKAGRWPLDRHILALQSSKALARFDPDLLTLWAHKITEAFGLDCRVRRRLDHRDVVAIEVFRGEECLRLLWDNPEEVALEAFTRVMREI